MQYRQWAARAVLAVAGVAGAQYATAAQVVVGQVAPLTGLEAAQGRAYSLGMQLYFNQVNRAGGVNGHTFSLVRRDDNGRPDETVSATRALLADDKPMVLAGFFGSPNIAEVLASGLLQKERIALVGYRTTELRPQDVHLYNVRATLRDELHKLTEHLATIGITRLGLFYEDGPGAQAMLQAATEAAAKARATIETRASYPAGTARAQQAVAQFLKNPPQAILMVASGAAAAAFIEQYRAEGGAAQLFAHSGADIEQLSKRLSEEQMQGVAIAQVTPNPYRISTRVGKEFNDIVAKTPALEVPVSYSMIEGFIAAKVIVEAVRRQGPRPTREGMQRTLDAMESYDAGGYLVAFRPDQHNGSRFVELSIVSGAGRIRQ
ncbi:MAG TPA: ABC transporter substrate-binding protein [Ramlibacter sp.]|uniref:ABC transporter substrate-binding protein n=1 Tax=Ramlibacter sp. TaxID=1917967 RepID=UPI002D7F3D16|nr:ABC transporter substrate-binding protein [Ramlibacter sp.]HET8745770.1 ABC transporter substrate-binding protein [Ramlibacter sp.]